MVSTKKISHSLLILFTVLCMQAPLAQDVQAKPPHWAPAHGWRDHHDNWDDRHHRHYRHRSGYYEDVYVIAEPPVFVGRPHVEVQCDPGAPILSTVIGGTAGGLVGNQFGRGSGRTAAIIGGTILGGLIGRDIGYQDACAAQSLEYARTGTQVVWQDPGDNAAYSVLPTRNYMAGNGRYCREYQSRVNVGGRIQEGYGTACRQPDGSWEIVD